MPPLWVQLYAGFLLPAPCILLPAGSLTPVYYYIIILLLLFRQAIASLLPCFPASLPPASRTAPAVRPTVRCSLLHRPTVRGPLGPVLLQGQASACPSSFKEAACCFRPTIP